MPAIITHHIFGQDAATLLPAGILCGQEDLLAFLLGSQGPDPLWARFTTLPHKARICHELATRMHVEHMTSSLMALHNCVGHLRDEDKSIGRAFALGMASHYLLDSVMHPLIYAQEDAIIATDPTLENAHSEVHAIIEADLDSWLQWEKRGSTTQDTPCTQALARTTHIDEVTGAMMSQVAWEVFGLRMEPTEYGLALRDYKLLYRVIDKPTGKLLHVLARLERTRRPYSRLLAQSHKVTTSDECPFANLTHELWRDPATGEASFASIPDLFHDALLAWPTFSQRLAEGDERRLDAMIAGVDYNGRPSAGNLT